MPYLIPLLIGGVSLLIYLSIEVPAYPNSGDNLWYVPSALSIVTEGNIELSEFECEVAELPPWEIWLQDMSIDPRLVCRQDGYYNLFPAGTAFLCVPLVCGHIILEPPSGDENVIRYCNRMASRFAAVFAAVSAGLMAGVVLAMGYSRGRAVLISVIFAFATPHFSIHARGLWSHNVLVALLLAAVLLLVARRGRWCWLAALPLAAGFLVRPDSGLIIAIFSVFVFVYARKQFNAFAFTGGAVAALFALFSFATYGSILPPYYLASRLASDRAMTALAGHLISPGRGLFVFVPVFLFSVYGARSVWRQRDRYGPLYRYLSVLPLAHWVLISFFPHWWGGHSYGPRLFLPVVPFLVLLLLPATDSLLGAPAKRSRKAAAILFVFFVAWSFFVQLRGVTSVEVHRWNSAAPDVDSEPIKLWDWSNMQILARPVEQCRCGAE